MVLGKLGPWQIGPRAIFVANWAPADWAPANWAPADWAPWRQIGPRQFFSSSANWDLANRAPHPPPLPTPCMAKDNNFVKHYNVFTTMKKSFYINYICCQKVFRIIQNLHQNGRPSRMEALLKYRQYLGIAHWGGVSTLAKMGWENFHPK